MNSIDFVTTDLCKNSLEFQGQMENRFFPIGDLPQEPLAQPYAVYGSTRSPNYSKDREFLAYTGAVVFNLYGNNLKGLHDITETLEHLFHGYDGELVANGKTIQVDDITFEGTELPEYDEDQKMFLIVCNFSYSLQLF